MVVLLLIALVVFVIMGFPPLRWPTLLPFSQVGPEGLPWPPLA